ncbi:MAG: hypothetical protein H8D05_00870 [FCB group bacterium]|nr:hypothetical protein [FCB group bacterium]
MGCKAEDRKRLYRSGKNGSAERRKTRPLHCWFESSWQGFPRHGAELFAGDRKVGIVTSGSIAPSLGHGVCLGFVEKGFHKRGTELDAEVRDKKIQVEIVKLPFYKDGSRK